MLENITWNHWTEYKQMNSVVSIIYKYKLDLAINNLRGAYDKFPDFFRIGTFIDSTHMKL